MHDESRVRISAHLGLALEELGAARGEIDNLVEELRDEGRDADEVLDVRRQLARLVRELEAVRARVAEWE